MDALFRVCVLITKYMPRVTSCQMIFFEFLVCVDEKKCCGDFTTFVRMIPIGQSHVLKATRRLRAGMYLADQYGEEVLLPTKYIPEGLAPGDKLKVFVYLDNEGRPISTTLKPAAELYEFAYLRVRQMSRFGAFMEWGIEKDLLVPFSEQNEKMERGRSYLVYLYLDDVTGRMIATARIRRFLTYENIPLQEGQEAEMLICGKTQNGTQVIVENAYQGLVYKNETFGVLRPGEKRRGFVKQVREDGKIDMALQKQGYANVEPNAGKVLKALERGGGFLNLHDKSDPAEISRRMEMSKKTFKKAIGLLYKEGRIEILDHGIRLKA